MRHTAIAPPLVLLLLAACGGATSPTISSSGTSGAATGSGTASTSGGSSGGSGTSGSGSGTASSGSSSGGLIDDGGFPPGTDAYCAASAAAFCDSLEACSSTNVLFAAFYGTQQRCRDYQVNVWCYPLLEPLPGLPATPAAFVQGYAECTDALLAVLADAGPCVLQEIVDLSSNQALPAMCYTPPQWTPGLNPPGSPCVSANQCSSLYCDFSKGCGACAEPSPLTDAGSACSTNIDCALGLVCTQGTCASFIPRGQPCVAGAGASAACEPYTSCVDGTCQFRFGAGHPCKDGGHDECASQMCADSVCMANPIVSEGAICGFQGRLQGYVYCDPDSVCDLVNTPGQFGYCIARKSEGERCFVSGELQGDDCRLDLACVQGVCQTRFTACLSDGGRPLVDLIDAGPFPDASADYAAFLAAETSQATLLCQGLSACPGGSSLFDSYFAGSVPDCVSSVLSLTLVDADPPGTDSSSSATDRVLHCNELLAAFDPCFLAGTFFVPLPLPAVCATLGTFTPGSSCLSNIQCVSGNCSSTLTPGACGVCADVGDAGAICLTTQDCASGLVCAEGLCAAGLGFDAGCDPADPCLPPLACVGGRCGSPLDVDAGCDPYNSQCAPTLLCSAQTSRCVPLVLAEADGGCGMGSGGLAVCPSGSTCKLTNSVRSTGVCVAATSPGQACSAVGAWLQGNSNCQPPYTCVHGYCGAPDPLVCE